MTARRGERPGSAESGGGAPPAERVPAAPPSGAELREHWPESAAALVERQRRLAEEAEGITLWRPSRGSGLRLGGVWVVYPRGGVGAGRGGDPAWAAAVVIEDEQVLCTATVRGVAGSAYEPGLLALREGALLESALRALAVRPDVLLVNATGRDHPRRAGLALHLGAVVGLPTVGVTDRPLVARGAEPGPRRGDTSPLFLDGGLVAVWLRTRSSARSLVAHAGWRTDCDVARTVVLGCSGRWRTPQPLRLARQLARSARSRGDGQV